MKSRKIVLHFSKPIMDKPVVCYLSKDFDLTFNILRATITPKEEGLMVLELTGTDSQYRKGVKFLREHGVKIQPLSKDVIRNENTCTHCGSCLAVCPTEALTVDKESCEVIFDPQHCIGCELCLPACPPRAMEIEF